MEDKLQKFIEDHDRFILTTHENPDGDGVGSMLALGSLLKQLNKKFSIVVTPKLTPSLQQYDSEHWITPFSEATKELLTDESATWILIDASNLSRLGPIQPMFGSMGSIKACIDHHLTETPIGFDHTFTDSSASASAEIIYRLWERMLPGAWTRLAVRSLYLGLVADTGNFRFSNATPSVHRMAGHLIEQGASAPETYQSLYMQDSPSRVKLWSRVLGRLSLQADDRIAVLEVFQEDFASTGSSYDDVDELVQQPMRIPSVEVTLLVVQIDELNKKISLRSREHVDVNKICLEFGGGGHRLAAGAKLNHPPQDLVNIIVKAAQKQLPSFS